MPFRPFDRARLLARLSRLFRRSRRAPRICGICVIRNAVDLLPALCGHYLRIGVDRLVFVDDHSTDGTAEALQALMRDDPRVIVRPNPYASYRQRVLMNELASSALRDGYEIILPFDADEFWNLDAAGIRAMATQPGVLVGHWVQFAQERHAAASDRRNLQGIRYRAPLLDGTDEGSVARQERSFLCLTEPKIAFRSRSPVEIAVGQHSLERGPSKVLADGLELFHLPFRSLEALRQRGLMADRAREVLRPGENWQSEIFRAAVAEQRLAAVWAAHSAGADGRLDLPGGNQVPLIEDSRLRLLLEEALTYMEQHHPRILAGMPTASAPA